MGFKLLKRDLLTRTILPVAFYYFRVMFKDRNLPQLNLPQASFKFKNEDNKVSIFDVLRKRFIRLTPEEWVRQNFIAFLIDHLDYPSGKIGNEIEIKLHGLSKRCDSVFFDAFGSPLGIIEYKAPEIKIDQKVFDQIFSYNLKMKVPYLYISNGIKHFACKILDGKPQFLTEIPNYKSL